MCMVEFRVHTHAAVTDRIVTIVIRLTPTICQSKSRSRSRRTGFFLPLKFSFGLGSDVLFDVLYMRMHRQLVGWHGQSVWISRRRHSTAAKPQDNVTKLPSSESHRRSIAEQLPVLVNFSTMPVCPITVCKFVGTIR